MQDYAVLKQQLEDWMNSRPTIECQLQELQAGIYTMDDPDAELPYHLKEWIKIPDAPLWQIHLVWLSLEEARRATVVCGSIERAEPEEAEAMRAVLRDSLLRVGSDKIETTSPTKFRPLIVRLMMLVWIEAFRAHGAKRDDAIEFVAQLSSGTQIEHSASTMRAWYDKKHGVEYTGLKQLAGLIVNAPDRAVTPWVSLAFDSLNRNADVIKLLHEHNVITDEERLELRSVVHCCALVLRFLLGSLNRLKPEQNSKRNARRVSEIDLDRVLFSVLCRLLPGAQKASE